MSDIEVKKLKCLRCGNTWYPRIMSGKVIDPKVCAYCKSPYWKTKRVRFWE